MCDVLYVSSACNQTTTAANWGKNNLICFGSCHAVLIYDPNYGSGGKITRTLTGHEQRVNSVQWIPSNFPENEIVSGSADGTAIVWTLQKNNEFTCFMLKGHESCVNIVESIHTSKNSTLIATGSADSTIRLWLRKDTKEDFYQTQVLNLNYGICLSLKFSYLPKNDLLILASGMDDSKIHIHIEDEEKSIDFPFNFKHNQKIDGHENWVRAIDFKLKGNELFMVSCAQDNFIRLWKISSGSEQKETDLINSIEQYDFLMKRNIIETSFDNYIISLESVVEGHEGWVYSVCWHPKEMSFLSCSIDKTAIIWKFDAESNFWIESIRVGEVGGNTLGFYGGAFGPSGDSFMAYGYHGAFHIWNYQKESNTWKPGVTIGGHFNEVSDLNWEPKGEFIVSVSDDQTTRIHAPWTLKNLPTTWHEIARPQVHGYDMTSLAILSRYNFASGADEKVIRTFKSPLNFVENFRRLCQITEDPEGDDILLIKEKPQGAAVPSLGLSNKAVFMEDNIEQVKSESAKDPYPQESHFTAVNLNEPPTEETLLQNTLWPEVQKLYGHGYEIYSLAASSDGKYLASACKASSVEHAAILLWNTKNWTQIQKLLSHSLTVVQMEFSPNCQHLLSVSRDRRWSLFSLNNTNNQYELKAISDKKSGVHTRIIWCCSWTFDSQFFATGSRDGKTVIWGNKDDKYEHLSIKEFKGESVTALAFAPIKFQDYYVLAIGFETGIVSINLWKPIEGFKDYLRLDGTKAHHLTVRRLKFKPVVKTGEENNIKLASCGSDHSVRIYNISLTDNM